MSDRPVCPECGASGRQVNAVTLDALVEKDALDRFTGRDGFHFCPGIGCSVAYYDASGQRIGTDAVKVKIGVKSTEAPRPLCYCFGHSAEEIATDAIDNGRSTIAEDITSKCRQGLDRCEVENPRGACCLGDVRQAAKLAIASTSDQSEAGPQGRSAVRASARWLPGASIVGAVARPAHGDDTRHDG